MSTYEVRIVKPRSDSKLGILLCNADDGVEVLKLSAGGLAEASGAMRVGDILVKVNGTDIQDDTAATELVRDAVDAVVLTLRPAPTARSGATQPEHGTALSVGVGEAPVGDFYHYIQGCWKRNLQWREFGGGFRHLHSSNTLVCVEADAAPSSVNGQRALRWSFGQTLRPEQLSVAYVMMCTRASTGDMQMEWTIGTHRCSARYLAQVREGGRPPECSCDRACAPLARVCVHPSRQAQRRAAVASSCATLAPQSQLAIFEFMLGACVIVVTYHIRGPHMMAVNIVEAEAGQPPTVQLGEWAISGVGARAYGRAGCRRHTRADEREGGGLGWRRRRRRRISPSFAVVVFGRTRRPPPPPP